MNDGFDFILFLFSFLFLYLELRQKCDIILHMIVTQVVKSDTCVTHVTYVTVMVTQSYNIEKVIEDSRTNNIIQHSKHIYFRVG